MARRGHGRVIDYKAWTFMPSSTVQVGTSATTLGAGLLNFDAPGTILRCRGYFQASMDATKQVGDDMTMSLGLGIVSSDAAAAGAGSMPDPSGEPEYPWIWWGQLKLRAYLTGGAESWGTTAQRIEIDSKAMRRFKPSQSLVLIVQSSTSTGSPVVDYDFGQIRVLIGT